MTRVLIAWYGIAERKREGENAPQKIWRPPAMVIAIDELNPPTWYSGAA
eukprot:CAMPEP_0184687228 /NCGR_PEP_ID=MMETSP0312-20130426/25668_1 /TAXON_ID=31354 /ORGANISM="Compsopogon coeruleus, Strain SAG 36.94" /LENGTH=48 /DNA_ID= /DNA_START= /DNA_END= /DNA_ORIENTATION=